MHSDIYLWNTALSFAMVMILMSLSAILILFAAARHETSFWVFSAGYILGTISFFLFPAQAGKNPWIGIIAANTILILYHFCMTCGIRIFYAHTRPWPFRFWIYLILFITALLILTFVFPVYIYRASMFSFFVILLSSEFIIILSSGIRGLPRIIRYSVLFFFFSAIVFHGIRIVLLLISPQPGKLLMEMNAITTYTFSFTIMISIVWAGSLIMLDDIKLMNDMEKKNILLENLAMKDELTGVFNRHFLDQTFTAEMERQDRYQTPLSFIMIDIDHFKSINDRFGHDAGDIILTEVTHRILKGIRETDILFRWGGEEFFILMPHTDLSGAVLLAEKIRRTISESPIIPAGTVTASFGVAERKGGEIRCEVFKRIDQALYRAKNSGRNIVAIQTEQSVTAAAITIEWNKEWESGNSIIDAAHINLIRMGNTLINLSISPLPREKIITEMDKLLDLIKIHFAEEEHIIRKTGFPDADRHARIHTDLLADAGRFRERFISGVYDSSLIFGFIMNKLIVDHLISEDMRFFPYLKK